MRVTFNLDRKLVQRFRRVARARAGPRGVSGEASVALRLYLQANEPRGKGDEALARLIGRTGRPTASARKGRIGRSLRREAIRHARGRPRVPRA